MWFGITFHWCFGELLHYITSRWVQQIDVRYQPYHEVTTDARERKRHGTDCYQKSQPVCFVQIWYRSTSWLFKTFSELLPVLIHSWKLRRHQRRKDSFHTKSLTTLLSWTTKNFLLTMPFTKLRNGNPLEKGYLDYEKLICSGLATESALVIMKLYEIPLAGA